MNNSKSTSARRTKKRNKPLKGNPKGPYAKTAEGKHAKANRKNMGVAKTAIGTKKGKKRKAKRK